MQSFSSGTSIQMNEAVEYFKSFTGARDEIAQRYLGLTENIPEQAIQLFFDSPDLASGLESLPSISTSNFSNTSRNQAEVNTTRKNVDIVCLDSDDPMDTEDNDAQISDVPRQVTKIPSFPDIEDDESIARRIQSEIYEGSLTGTDQDTDRVRAPIERRREVLVGGVDGDDEDPLRNEAQSTNLHQMIAGSYSRLGVFNQTPVPSLWDSNTDPAASWQDLSQATGGASEASSKAARLAELFRPPFEIMRQVSWETARDQGKKERKWILVNVQDNSIFDCQQLNRDLWKHPGIKETIKENFIFVQYAKDDPRGTQYIQYYFQNKDNGAAYPHISIVDPRTGEQVKTWPGRSVPQAPDFLMQIYEFLDRYSLDMTKKNPVATRKPENSRLIDVDRLTEQEMLDIALQNSLSNGTATEKLESDPDDLTRSSSDTNKGKGKEITEESIEADPKTQEESNTNSAFAQISSKNFHQEPSPGNETTRIQFKHAGGRIVRRFNLNDPVRRIYEWLKSQPIEEKLGVDFELKVMGKDLINFLDETVEMCGLKNTTIMVEFLNSDE